MELELDPANLVFDPEEGLLHFIETEGRASLECCIFLASLAALTQDTISGAEGDDQRFATASLGYSAGR
jgi:hypothetical protein